MKDEARFIRIESDGECIHEIYEKVYTYKEIYEEMKGGKKWKIEDDENFYDSYEEALEELEKEVIDFHYSTLEEWLEEFDIDLDSEIHRYFPQGDIYEIKNNKLVYRADLSN